MTDLSQLSDQALIELALRRVDAAFRQLVERYQGHLYGCAYAITGNTADAADATQDAFISFHRHLEQYDPSRPLRPYLLTIAANCSRRLVRGRSRFPVAAEQEQLERMPDTAADTIGRLHRGERQAGILRLVEALPQTMREVCSLFYLQQCSCREVADILGMSESAVKTALHRARRKLLADGVGQWRTLS